MRLLYDFHDRERGRPYVNWWLVIFFSLILGESLRAVHRAGIDVPLAVLITTVLSFGASLGLAHFIRGRIILISGVAGVVVLSLALERIDATSAAWGYVLLVCGCAAWAGLCVTLSDSLLRRFRRPRP